MWLKKKTKLSKQRLTKESLWSESRGFFLQKEVAMKNQAIESTDVIFAKNKKNTHNWAHKDLARELYRWVHIFNNAFFKEQPVAVDAISFENKRVTILRYYVGDKIVLGIRESINLNRIISSRPFWDILSTLLHEMTHSWQANYGKPSNSWFHNKEFQIKLKDCGIVCDNKGCHIGLRDPFVSLLKSRGIPFNKGMEPELDGTIKIPPKNKPKGKSKLKKWTCGCTNVRVAVKEFEAKCRKCCQDFKRAS
jgi:hypothetical protein